METNRFFQKLNTLYQRADKFYRQVSVDVQQQPDLAVEAIEELGIAIEELQVAEAELIQQNQELEVARAAIEAERQRYYELFELAPDGYLVTDKHGKIQEANRAAADLLNLSQRFLIGKLLANFITEEERQIFRSKLNQLTQEVTADIPAPQEWELSLRPRHAPPVNVAITVSAVLGKESQFVNLRWLLRDITARKQAEATIRQVTSQNLQLQEATRLKSQFLAIMSHELRSPMNAIIGFSQLLLRPTPSLLASSQVSMIERILKSGMHLLKLIDDILDFSKLEANQLELQPEEINLAALVTDITEELRPLAEQKHLGLQVEINLANPDIVNDRDRLRQILVNLIANATKFTNTGSVRVEARELAADRLQLVITDTGIGIAETDIPLLFQEFRQVNQTIARQHSGTGLGLAIVDRLVRMMRGRITVESVVGQGSTFRVELPRQVEVSS